MSASGGQVQLAPLERYKQTNKQHIMDYFPIMSDFITFLFKGDILSDVTTSNLCRLCRMNV